MTTVSAAVAPMIEPAMATARTVVLSKTLRVNRRGLLGWTAGITLAAVMYASFYPQMAKNGAAQAENVPEGLRDALHMDDIASAPGYLGATVFGLIVPLLAMLAIRGGADLTAISAGQFAAQCVHLTLLTVTFGALATGLGAAFGRRGVVFAVTAVVGVAAYAAHAFAAQIGLGWAAYLSPFHYYIDSEPLRNGVGWTGLLVLATVSALLVTAGTFRFNHRDLG